MLAIKKRLQGMGIDAGSLMQFMKLFESLYNTQMLTAANWSLTGTAPITGNAIAAVVGGMLSTKATGTSTAALNGPTVQNTGATWQVWLFTLDQTGTLFTYAGTPGTTSQGAILPMISDYATTGYPQAVVGGLLINNASASAFVPGTTSLSTSGLNPVAYSTVGPFFPIQYM